MNDVANGTDAQPKPASSRPPRFWRFFVRALFGSYLLQLLVIGFWRFFPVDRRDHESIHYSIHRGFGRWPDFIPALGLVAAIGDGPVYLSTTDTRTGKREICGYDIAEDIYAAFPSIWPDKQK